MVTSLIARFMGPTWGPSGADRPQVGPILAPWTLLSGITHQAHCSIYIETHLKSFLPQMKCLWNEPHTRLFISIVLMKFQTYLIGRNIFQVQQISQIIMITQTYNSLLNPWRCSRPKFALVIRFTAVASWLSGFCFESIYPIDVFLQIRVPSVFNDHKYIEKTTKRLSAQGVWSNRKVETHQYVRRCYKIMLQPKIRL